MEIIDRLLTELSRGIFQNLLCTFSYGCSVAVPVTSCLKTRFSLSALAVNPAVVGGGESVDLLEDAVKEGEVAEAHSCGY